ncbi:MAG: CHAT domain-containing protein [Desulfobacterales bacterium]|nr:CHAT domain-containing protein [Desulfobacterales bacterium]
MGYGSFVVQREFTLIFDLPGLAIFILFCSESYPFLSLLEVTNCDLQSAVETMDPGMLHLAMHGGASEKHPEAGLLVLPNSSGPREDAILSFRRLARLELSRLQLVVLSACSGAAGASRAVAGRHDAGDRATFAMMIQFYRDKYSDLSEFVKDVKVTFSYNSSWKP